LQKLEKFVHIGWATKWIHKLSVFCCVCGTAGLAKTIGLGKDGQREKDLRLVKENIIHFLLINPNEMLLSPFHIKV